MAETTKRGPITLEPSEYDGPIYCDGAWNAGYLADYDDFEDWLATTDTPRPEFVWACTVKPLAIPSALDLCDQLAENSYESAYDDLTSDCAAIAELQRAIDTFNAREFAREYTADLSRRIRVPPAPEDSTDDR